MTELAYSWSGKTLVLIDMFILVAEVSKSADKHCLRREVGMRSGDAVEITERVRWLRDDFWHFFSDVRENAEISRCLSRQCMRWLVLVCQGGVWGYWWESVEVVYEVIGRSVLSRCLRWLVRMCRCGVWGDWQECVEMVYEVIGKNVLRRCMRWLVGVCRGGV